MRLARSAKVLEEHAQRARDLGPGNRSRQCRLEAWLGCSAQVAAVNRLELFAEGLHHHRDFGEIFGVIFVDDAVRRVEHYADLGVVAVPVRWEACARAACRRRHQHDSSTRAVDERSVMTTVN